MRQRHEFFASGVEEWIAGDDERIGPLLDEGCKGCAELAFGSGIHDVNLQPERTCSLLQGF